jgi:hypothetical protein
MGLSNELKSLLNAGNRLADIYDGSKMPSRETSIVERVTQIEGPRQSGRKRKAVTVLSKASTQGDRRVMTANLPQKPFSEAPKSGPSSLRSRRTQKAMKESLDITLDELHPEIGVTELASPIVESPESALSSPLSSVPPDFGEEIEEYHPAPRRQKLSSQPRKFSKRATSFILRLGPVDWSNPKIANVLKPIAPVTSPVIPQDQVPPSSQRRPKRTIGRKGVTKKAALKNAGTDSQVLSTTRTIRNFRRKKGNGNENQEPSPETDQERPIQSELLSSERHMPISDDSASPSLVPHEDPLTPSSSEPFGDSTPVGLALDDPELRPLSDALYALTETTHKPETEGHPLVWADSRQELCEALPYFRQLYGGSQAKGGVASGFMFDSHSHPRDYMDSTVIISRAGGGLEHDDETGEMIVAKDQKKGMKVKSVLNNIAQKNAVIITSGSGNTTGNSTIPRTYSVLSHWKPTHVWSEKTNGKRIIRYRFEKLRPDEPSWWKGKGVTEPVRLGDLSPPVTFKCPKCQDEHPQVYLNGYICLNAECSAFWKLSDEAEPVESQLRYDPRFLKQYTPWPHSDGMYPLKPESWALSEKGSWFGKDFSWEATRAIVCPSCGRCGSRVDWSFWKCKNPDCQKMIKLPHNIIPAEATRDWFQPLGHGYMPSFDLHHNSISLQIQFAHNYRVNIYTIPGIDGFVAHMIANKTVVEESGGPDDMFVELQTADANLKRRDMKSGQTKGTTCCNHFYSNFGMPYKFVASVDSSSFEAAPKAIQSARSRLNWARRFLVGEDSDEFNEVLAIGYMEKNSIKVRFRLFSVLDMD